MSAKQLHLYCNCTLVKLLSSIYYLFTQQAIQPPALLLLEGRSLFTLLSSTNVAALEGQEDKYLRHVRGSTMQSIGAFTAAIQTALPEPRYCQSTAPWLAPYLFACV